MQHESNVPVKLVFSTHNSVDRGFVLKKEGSLTASVAMHSHHEMKD